MAESIRRRYLSKIIGNISSGVILLSSQSLISRFLGPAFYGQLSFIQAHFEAIFTDFGLSSTLYTRLAQDKKNYPHVAAAFILLVGILIVASLLYVVGAFAFQGNSTLWPEIKPSVIWLGLILGLSTFLGRMGVFLTDAAGISQRVETARFVRALFALSCIVLLGLFHRLTLSTALLVLALAQISFLVWIYGFGHRAMGNISPDFSKSSLKNTYSDFAPHAGPILLYGVFALAISLFDRWLLQYIAGSAEQSYFGVAMQISTALFLSTCALTSIFHREVALAFTDSDSSRLNYLFRVYTKRIFAVAAIPCVFVAVNSLEIARAFGGVRYISAAPTIALMAIYPIMQGAGQLSVAFQYATNQTRLYTIVGIFRDSIGILITYFLVAKTDLGLFSCLGLGAIGLAFKSLIAVATTTYFMHFANCRYLGLRFGPYLRGEFLILAVVTLAAFFSKSTSDFIFQALQWNLPFLNFVVRGILYTSIVGAFILLRSSLFGLEGVNLLPLRQFILRARTGTIDSPSV